MNHIGFLRIVAWACFVGTILAVVFRVAFLATWKYPRIYTYSRTEDAFTALTNLLLAFCLAWVLWS